MSREYKDSGIEWIGKIPKEWKNARYKFSGCFVKGKLPANQNNEKLGVPIIGASEMLGKECRTFTTDANVPTCSCNDILILWDGANAGIVANKCEGAVSSTAVKYTCTDERFNKQYLFYLLKNAEPFFKSKVNGTTIPHMNSKYIDDYVCLLPSLSAQQKIADHLDKVCGEVNELISLQETMIEELKAYKQSVITEAVTKGLNPNVPMKDSGIDWMGEVPAHWGTTKIKRIARTNSGSTPRNISDSDDSNIIWIRTTDINDEVVYDSSLHLTVEEYSSASCPMLNEGTCIVAMYGGGGTIGKSGKLGVKATINQALCSMEVGDSFTGEYLFCILRSVRYYWMKYAVGTRKDPNINQEIVRNLNIPFPPLAEQRSIASYLDTKCSEIDSLIALKQTKIEELKEYKKSVIYEFVTGKKEVC